MPWFVVLAVPAGQSGPVAASVKFYATEKAFQQATNESAVTSGPNQNEYATKAAAQASADAYNGQPAGKRSMGSSSGNAPSGTTKGVGFQLPAPLQGLAAIGDFFARLTEASTWLRLGEGILGIILIAVGVARITHAVPIATKIAGAVT